MNFQELLKQAKSGNEEAILRLMDMYEPLLTNASILNDHVDEDLLQEQRITLLKCISMFQM